MNQVNEINEEITLLRKSIRNFAKKEIAPYFEQWEKDGVIPRSLWGKLGISGFLCVDIPEQYGGLGASTFYSAVIIDELSKLGYNSVATNISVHSNIIAHYILSAGTEEQKQYYLPKMATGELISAIAMTEPGAGSDLQGIKTSAVKTGEDDAYNINGAKTFITNGQMFNFVIVVARTNLKEKASRGMSLFILHEDDEGVIKGKKLEKIGLQSADTSELFFENVRVPSNRLLGELDRGFTALMNELPRERITLAIAACGAMDGALEMTKQYIHEREAFGKPLKEIQVIRHKFAEMLTESKVNRAYVDSCIHLLEKNKLSTTDASIAKLSSTEAQGRIMDGCLQMFGGYGYMKEYPISRAYTDARVQRIYGGASEIMKEIISKGVLD